MPEEILCSIDPQTTRIDISIAPRAAGTQPGQLDITVTATKSKVVLDDTGEVLGVLGTETKVLSNVAAIEGFSATYATLKAAVDAEFAPPASEPSEE